jgi:hypothetical protein
VRGGKILKREERKGREGKAEAIITTRKNSCILFFDLLVFALPLRPLR